MCSQNGPANVIGTLCGVVLIYGLINYFSKYFSKTPTYIPTYKICKCRRYYVQQTQRHQDRRMTESTIHKTPTHVRPMSHRCPKLLPEINNDNEGFIKKHLTRWKNLGSVQELQIQIHKNYCLTKNKGKLYKNKLSHKLWVI